MLLRSIVCASIVIGYDVIVLFCISVIYVFTPFESDMISAIPIMPIEPANAVSVVLAFFVSRLLKLSESDVRNDIEALPMFLWTGALSLSSSGSYGCVSPVIFPSRRNTVRVAYFSARSGL